MNCGANPTKEKSDNNKKRVCTGNAGDAGEDEVTIAKNRVRVNHLWYQLFVYSSQILLCLASIVSLFNLSLSPLSFCLPLLIPSLTLSLSLTQSFIFVIFSLILPHPLPFFEGEMNSKTIIALASHPFNSTTLVQGCLTFLSLMLHASPCFPFLAQKPKPRRVKVYCFRMTTSASHPIIHFSFGR